MYEAILKGKLENHLGYESNSKLEKTTTNRRNGYSDKILKTSMGETEIAVPRDRDVEFESLLIPKHKRDVSDIDRKVIAMYSRGMSTSDISATINDIYGFKLSAEQISKITDCVLDEQQNWQNRPLKPFYPFIFIDCLFVNIHRDYITEFYRKWAERPVANWALVRNQLLLDERLNALFSKFDH